MKRKRSNNKSTWIISLALCAAGSAAFAQGPGGGPDGPGPDGGPPPPPPLPPVIQALDTNHDGIIEANEIANAPQALRTLEKSGSDVLTIPELLGPPPSRPGQQPPQGNPPATTGTQGADSQNPPPPPDGGPQADNQNGPPPGPPPGGPGRHHRVPPIIAVLDANHDGIIDTNEINNAAQELKQLDTNNTGQLTIPQLLGPPPGMRGFGPPPGLGGPDGQQPPMQSGTDGDAGGPPPPPPPMQSGTDGQPDNPPPPPQ